MDAGAIRAFGVFTDGSESCLSASPEAGQAAKATHPSACQTVLSLDLAQVELCPKEHLGFISDEGMCQIRPPL